MNAWNLIYSHFDPVAFSVFSVKVHWYSLMYALALIFGLYLANFFARNMSRFKNIDEKIVNSFFIYIEVGIILGARFGYLFIYTDNALYYLTRPWQAFNPFINGEFVGIMGMSFHGAIFGGLIASLLFSYIKKVDILNLLDLVALAIPLPYIFGRIGNFLNKELFGRVIESEDIQFLGIFIHGEIRYPSQLIEAFLEGLVLFFIIYFISIKSKTHGYLIAAYGVGYSLMRFIAEFFREADAQMGYYFLHLSMGQILSILMVLISLFIFYISYRRGKMDCI